MIETDRRGRQKVADNPGRRRKDRTIGVAMSEDMRAWIAEKAADLILGNTSLPPEKVEIYRA